MGRVDLLVLGSLLHPDGSLVRGGVAVHGGRIVDLTRRAAADRTLDLGASLLAPGAIDPHVHFREPGATHKEDFGTGTAGAALGGVTTVLDMPNTSPPVFTRTALDEKRRLAEAKANVDVGLYVGLDAAGASIDLLPEASAMKIYLGATTGNLLVRDMDLVRRALLAAGRAGRTVAVHAESQECLERHAGLLREDHESHADARPAVCEADAIRSLRVAARGTGARVHVAHLTTAAGLAAMAGSSLTAEVTPHHLLLTREALRRGGRFKMNPPLREERDADALWAALAEGRIACLGSDHAPHTVDEKAAPRPGDCPAGVPGVQTMVPLLLAKALRGRLPLARVVDASTAAARVFGLAGKGALAPGFDADLAAYDLRRESRVEGARLASKVGWTPFEGMPAVFPTHVLVRGETVVEDGVLAGPPRGRVLKPQIGTGA